MNYLMELLAGKPESDIERSVDRYFTGSTASSVIGSFFDPDKRRKQLENDALEKYLTSQSSLSRANLSAGASLIKPAKGLLSHLAR